MPDAPSSNGPVHYWAKISRAILIACLAHHGVADAQVSIEAFRAQIPDDGVSAAIEGRLTGDSGNTRGISAGAAAFFGGRSDPHLGFLALSGSYNRYSDEVDVENYFGHLRYNYEIYPPMWWEAFAQVEHDRFKRLQLRRLVGSGPRFRILDTKPVRAYLGTAYMLELESLDASDDSPASNSTTHRWSNYLSAVYQADERVTLSVMAFFQPRFDAFADYRVLLLSSADFEVTDRLSAGLHVNCQYDSEPPEDVKRTDVSVINTLGLHF